MKIGNVDLDQKTLVIAEIGNNHEGSFERAREMISLAAQAGADVVKFQTIVPEYLVAPSQKQRIDQLRRFQFSMEQFADLAQWAAENGVMFMSTPFAPQLVPQLDPLVPAFKIASGDNDYTDLLIAVAATGKPVVISAGMTDIEAITLAKTTIEGEWNRRGFAGELAVLHCVVSYPTAPEDANLAAIEALKALGCTVGYSDHTIGIDAAVLSVAMGARIVEKHFTISKTLSDFRDHQLSADPDDLAEMVRRIRDAERLIGRGGKQILEAEQAALGAVRRSVRITADLEAGAVLTAERLVCLRPADGLPASELHRVIGRRLARTLAAGEAVTAEDLL